METSKRLRNTLLILGLLMAVGAIAYVYSQHVAIEARRTETAHRLETFSRALFTPMDKYDYLPAITSSQPPVIDALKHQKDPERIRKLNVFLQRLNGKAKSEAIYVTNAEGSTIASSNWRDPVNFVGQNYFFRPYFQDAISGKEGRFYALGTVSQLPGYYLSHQVVSDNRLLGVVVIKVDLGDLDAKWEEDKDVMVVTDENGIIFLTSRKDWKYRALGKLDEKTIEQLERTQQYGSPLKAPIIVENESNIDKNNRIVRIRESDPNAAAKGKRYFVNSATLQNSKWVISIFTPLAETDTRSRQTAFAAVATFTLMIVLFMYFQQAGKRRRENEASQRALQQAHQELEAQHGELEKLNLHLQSQSEKLKLTVSELEAAKVEADAANLAKSEFLASMSHEIRTPMSAILGLTHLALKTELTSKQRNYLLNVDGAATALLGILNNILDFSKIEAGKLPLEHIAFDLRQVLSNISAIVALSAESKGIELIFRVDPSLPCGLVGDPLRLGQILLNLVNNAIKFTERGEVVVSVDSAAAADDRIGLRVSIKDTGIGISGAQLNGLFQSFSQADQSTTRRYGGTGLGLAISKKLSEAMGGTIEVTSTLGHGSTFTFSAEFDLAADSGMSFSESMPDLSGLRVLAVDDNPAARNALASMLSACSIRVTVLSSGAAAIKLLTQASAADECPFDVVLLDYRMPEMDGVETARRIIEQLPSPPRIVLMTPYGSDDAALSGRQTGVHAFVSKPLDPSVLLAALSDVADGTTASGHADAEAGVSGRHDVTGLRVLVAEDNEINRHMVREILESNDIICEMVANGREAVRAARSGVPYDLILMDLEMPEMDGLEAAREIRKHAKRHIPILALTAYATEQDRQRCLEAGIDFHLTKPVNPDHLIAEISRWATQADLAYAAPPPAMEGTELIEVSSLIAEIDALLACNNIGAEELTLELRCWLEGRGHDTRLDHLEQAVDRLDYRSARRLLAEIVEDIAAANSGTHYNQ